MVEIEVKQNASGAEVELSGRLDTVSSMSCEAKLSGLSEYLTQTIVLECKKLDYVCSSGLRIFLSLQKQVMAKGGDLIFRNVNDEIQGVFKMTGLSAFFRIE